MNNKNFEYTGWKINGFVALVLILAAIVGAMFMIVKGANTEVPMGPILVVGGALILLLAMISCKGFMLLEPNEARVLTFFGEYRGSFYNTGFWWVNFLMSAKNISLRARNLNAEPIKVNDKTGNPIMIGLVLVWRLKRDEIYRSVFDIDATADNSGIVTQGSRMKMLENFVVGICGCQQSWTPASFVESTVKELREKLGDDKVVLGLSGGVDSSVAAALLSRAIGKQLHCVFVDHGLMRKDESEGVIKTFFDHGGEHIQINVVDTKTLRDAQKNPENYKGLMVRVAGYMAYFTELDESAQEAIIYRTAHLEEEETA